MKTRPEYLTKSRYKLGLECPTKLYYTNKAEYVNSKVDNPFLKALAEGGFQVGELAKLYFPGGVEVKQKDKAEAVKETNALLKRDNVVIFEAAVLFKNLFIRIDILEKKGDELNLIEVKSSSTDAWDASGFFNKKGNIDTKWRPYIDDAVFQTHVLKNAFSGFCVKTFLMLTDKNAKTSVEGLHQKFLITHDDNSQVIIKVQEKPVKLGNQILKQFDISEIVKKELKSIVTVSGQTCIERINELADSYVNDYKITPAPGAKCKVCEYKCSDDDLKKGLKSGYRECLKSAWKFTNKDFKRPLTWDINSIHYKKRDKLLENNKPFMDELENEEIITKSSEDSAGLSSPERQWLQVEKTVSNDSTPYLDIDGLRREVETWKYPLHMIDFETSRSAIPFNISQRPYHGIAFQFSHHIIKADGTVQHQGEYINVERGVFPNYNFIRELEKQLSNDDGSVFCYAAHENSFLKEIYYQLKDENNSDVPDKDELMSFIKTIAKSGDKDEDQWKIPPRVLIDLCELVKKYFYHIRMGGSNSIKVVLPTVLNISNYLKKKYANEIYGRGLEIESLNYDKMAWVRFDETGEVIDPYKLLESVADGGAAMTAYARMQFSNMDDDEFESLKKALLKYCELDTLAMVFICEYFLDCV